MRRGRSLLALLLLACEPTPSPDDAGADAAIADAGVPCPAIPPIVGGTPETDALANAPARCGAPSYAWLRDETLGDVLSREVTGRYTAETLAGLAAAAGVTLPAPPEHDVRIETLVYRTQDRGAPVQSTTLIAYPSDLEERTEVPILLFLHGTSGFTRGCGPTGDPATALLTGVLASYGWIAVAPDYLGLESDGDDYPLIHPYLIGEAVALPSLDAVRAAIEALSADAGAVCASPRVGVLGGSEGGHAALWVDRLAPYYARELELIGTVATVPPGDTVAHAERALTEIVEATAAIMAAVVTQPEWYGAAERVGEALVSPWDVELPAALEASCDPGEVLPDVPPALGDVFTSTLLDAASAGTLTEVEPFGCYLRESGLTTTSVPRIGPTSSSYGILYVLGENDPLVHTPIERTAYETLCAAGVPLSYLECAGANHTEATAWALPEILEFMLARRAGEPFTPECTARGPVTCRGTPAP